MKPGGKLIKGPVYKGGPKAMSEFIKKNLTYPEQAKEHKIEGIVVTFIDIDHTGKVTRVKIKKKLGYGCDEEAERLVRLLQFFVENKRKMKITHHKTIKVHFRLPKDAPKAKRIEQTVKQKSQGLEIVYTYVPTKK